MNKIYTLIKIELTTSCIHSAKLHTTTYFNKLQQCFHLYHLHSYNNKNPALLVALFLYRYSIGNKLKYKINTSIGINEAN